VPTVGYFDGFRLFFYSNENQAGPRPEPPHIHVEKYGRGCEFWLSPVTIKEAGDMPTPERKRVERLVTEHRRACLAKWNDYFGTSYE
jgi:hypothetical protein